jgi:hypothetical protein
MNSEFKRSIYDIACKFIELINTKNTRLLADEFGVSESVSLELFEILGDYFDGAIPSLSAPPIDKAFSRKIQGKIPFDIYEMNNPDTWGVDCSLWVDGNSVEPILHLQFSKSKEDLIFHYKYIGS